MKKALLLAILLVRGGGACAAENSEDLLASALDAADFVEPVPVKAAQKWKQPPPHPEGLKSALGSEVDFFTTSSNTGSDSGTVRAAEGGFLYYWAPGGGDVHAVTADGRKVVYPVRDTGVGHIRDVYLPPDIVRFKQGSYAYDISRTPSAPDILAGRPWLRWMEAHLQPGSRTLKDRAALYGFMSSLFRLDWDASASLGENAALQELPKGARPRPEAIASILGHLADIWQANDLESVHGSFDYWLVLAATSRTQAPSTLWRAAGLVHSLHHPRAMLYLVKMLSLHLRGLPGHPIEHYGTPERMRSGFVDVEILIHLLPEVVSTFLREFQDKPREVPAGTLSERQYYLWVIATALDPSLYLDGVGEKYFGVRYPYREQMLAELDKLGQPGRLGRLYDEISKTPWGDYGLKHPIYAAAKNQPIYEAVGQNNGLMERLTDSRPIRLFAFSPKDQPEAGFRGDPGFLNMGKDTQWLDFRGYEQVGLPSTGICREEAYKTALANDRTRFAELESRR